MKKRLAQLSIFLVFTLLCLETVTACGDKEATESSRNSSVPASSIAAPTTTTVADTALEADISLPSETTTIDNSVYKHYLDTIQDNWEDILAYNWRNDWTAENAYGGLIAIHDIIGDETPELLFMSSTTDEDGFRGGWSKLSIYTYSDRTSALFFEKDIGMNFGGGFDYCLFLTKDNDFYLYESCGDEEWVESFSKISENEIADMFAHVSGPNDDYTSTINTYTSNKKEIPESAYQLETSAIIQDVKTVLLFSLRGNEAIYQKTDLFLESVEMSYSDAVQYLQKKISETTRPSEAPATSADEKVIDYLSYYDSVLSAIRNHILDGTYMETTEFYRFLGMVDMSSFNPLTDIGYALTDLNGDGIPELLFLTNENLILTLYTLVNDSPVLLDVFGYRYNVIGMDADGTFYAEGSGGAFSGWTRAYRVQTNNSKLFIVSETGVESYDGEAHSELSEPRWYMIAEDGTKSILREDEVRSRENAYPQNIGDIVFPFIPIAPYLSSSALK